MTKQRSRRSFLAGVGAAAAGIGGCTALALDREGGVSMLVAGSLADAVEDGLREAVDQPLRAEAHGSARVARLVRSGGKDPDIVSLADTDLFGRVLPVPWYAAFATTSLVVAYTTETAGGRRVRDAGREGWYDALRSPDVRLGRTDPDLDPLGYRTLFLFSLAADHYGVAGLADDVLAADQLYPETQLLSQFETGGVDAAVVYRSVAEARDLEYVSLPAAVDLSDPERADYYARVSYELPDGTVVEGGPIEYGTTMRRATPAVRAVFEEHLTGEYLEAFGFETPAEYPRYTGDVPDALA
jgi:molybdate/tungstate transport system substrate-binding protein